MQKNRFLELDALRGIAALAVVVFHFTRYVTVHNHFGDFPGPFSIGERGVQLFFMVSGFVIFYTLQRSRNLKDFAFSRFSRLYPAYWASLAIAAAFGLLVMHHKVWLTGYAVNSTMLQEFVGVQDLDVVYWTLAIELVFYGWMAIVFATGQLKRMTLLALIWLSVSAAWAIARQHATIPGFVETYFLVKHIPYFIAGIMFRRVQMDGWNKTYSVVLVAALIDVFLIGGGVDLLAASCLFSVFALVVAGKLPRLANPLLLWLGAISYTLYVTHRNIGYDTLRMLHDNGVSSLVSVPTVSIAALGLATVVTYYVEKPTMAVLRNWYSSRKDLSAQEISHAN
jgi:peptidoglycan/LPS O-acetylase OafA/YrhL